MFIISRVCCLTNESEILYVCDLRIDAVHYLNGLSTFKDESEDEGYIERTFVLDGDELREYEKQLGFIYNKKYISNIYYIHDYDEFNECNEDECSEDGSDDDEDEDDAEEVVSKKNSPKKTIKDVKPKSTSDELATNPPPTKQVRRGGIFKK
jgi:hypothetical protein